MTSDADKQFRPYTDEIERLGKRCEDQTQIIVNQHEEIRKLEIQLQGYRELLLEAMRSALQSSWNLGDQSRPSSEPPLSSE